MAELKGTWDTGMFLVLGEPHEQVRIHRDHYKLPPPGRLFSNGLTQDIVQSNKYITHIIREELGVQFIQYESNIEIAREYWNTGDIRGIILPFYVAEDAIPSLVARLGSRDTTPTAPVFKAGRHLPGYKRYKGPLCDEFVSRLDEDIRERWMHKAFRKWVRDNFK